MFCSFSLHLLYQNKQEIWREVTTWGICCFLPYILFIFLLYHIYFYYAIIILKYFLIYLLIYLLQFHCSFPFFVFVLFINYKWNRQDSNLRQTAYEAVALTAELLFHVLWLSRKPKTTTHHMRKYYKNNKTQTFVCELLQLDLNQYYRNQNPVC